MSIMGVIKGDTRSLGHGLYQEDRFGLSGPLTVPLACYLKHYYGLCVANPMQACLRATVIHSRSIFSTVSTVKHRLRVR